MPDPADKSDDLIAELAKLMASAPGGTSGGVQPPAKPAPLNTAQAPQPAPVQASPPPQQPAPFRIPGMEGPITPRPAAPAPQPEQRAPSTGSIRIPGMDQPAPVSTSAPVGKFDFGGKPAVAPIKQEPLSSFTDRLQAGRNLANDTAPRADVPPAPIRIPSDLKPVSENKSFGEGPALSVGRPATPAPTVAAPVPVTPPPAPPVSSSDDFDFDFGLSAIPSPAPVVEPSRQSPPAHLEPEPEDPIAALIAADMAEGEPEADEEIEAAAHEHYEPKAEPARPAVVTPMIRTVGPQGPRATTMAPASQAPQRPQGSAPIPLKPVSVAPRAAVDDRFAISPGVGLNMKPPAAPKLGPQPRAPEPASDYDDSDPMSEIESLIGEAVRVELTPGPVRVQTPQQVAPKVQLERGADLEREIRQSAAPVVPPLTTAFAPRRANLKDDAANASAEDAILAAAAASGADVGRIDPQLGDDSPYRRLKVKPQRSSFLSGGMRQYVGMAVAGTLLLAAGLGLYWVLNMGRTSSTAANTAPQLTADATPIKVKPAATETPVTDSAKSPVLAKMDGTTSTSTEQLVSTDETNGGTVNRDVTPTTADGGDESGLANRKVRTVTVRPDGTIVSGDSALAGGEALPIDRPNVPAVPSTESTNLLGAADTQGASTDPTTTDATAADATTQVADTQAVIDPNAVAPTPMNFPVRNSAAPLALTTSPKNTKVNALTAPAKTNTGATDLLGDSQDPQVAAVTPPKKTQAPAAVSSGGNAPAYVQLSSQPTQADAQASIRAVTAKYGSLFAGNSLTVQQVDLGQKGVKWRVRLPAASLSEATSICSQIKAQGGDCFPTKG